MRLIDADQIEQKMQNLVQSYRGTLGGPIYATALEWVQKAPTIDAAPVVHGRWKYYHKQNIAVCTNCSFERDLDANFGKAISCPNCGAKMDLEVAEK